MRKKRKIDITQLINFNETNVYFLENKKVFRGGRANLTGMRPRIPNAVYEDSIVEIKETKNKEIHGLMKQFDIRLLR